MSESMERIVLIGAKPEATKSAQEKLHLGPVEIGAFLIRRMGPNSIWIERDDGEGAEFPESALEQTIEAFYSYNF